MDCGEVAELLDAYALGAAEREEARALREHVADCLRCWDELRVIIQKLRIAAVFAASVAAVLVGFSFASPASAHSTPDAAPDTPFASQAGLDHGLSHYLDALGHSQAENALLRNPTCGEHNNGSAGSLPQDGIHPPGNP